MDDELFLDDINADENDEFIGDDEDDLEFDDEDELEDVDVELEEEDIVEEVEDEEFIDDDGYDMSDLDDDDEIGVDLKRRLQQSDAIHATRHHAQVGQHEVAPAPPELGQRRLRVGEADRIVAMRRQREIGRAHV